MKAMIISVGGTSEPIITAIIEHRPEYVCFFASQQSLDAIGDIKRRIKEKGHTFNDYKVVCDDVNDLIHCYEIAIECARKISEKYQQENEVIVDYTGGTKTMTAALALATVGRGYAFSYVGGQERTKDGLGVVVTGTEVVRTGISPWQLFAVEEKKRISLFISSYQYEAAISTMRETLSRLSRGEQELWGGIITILEGYLAWDNFDHKSALKHLSSALKQLNPLRSVLRDSGMRDYLDDVESSFAILNAMNQSTNYFKVLHSVMVRDLVSNARRRYSQGKYDDAVARLYRALEMIGQIAFESVLGCGTSEVMPEKLPSSLKAEFVSRYGASSGHKLKLPLFATFRVLRELGEAVGVKFSENEENLRDLLSARNSSILAHGVVPIGKRTYERFEQIIADIYVKDALIEFPELAW